MEKRAFGSLMAATMLLSVLAGINLVSSNVVNGMAFDPVETIVDPPMDGSDLTFSWNLTINTTILVSSWEALLWWDRTVLRCLGIEFGSFMTGASVGEAIRYGQFGESVRFGQYFTAQQSVTGEGVLATMNFTFVKPGVTVVQFFESTVWDDDLDEYNLLPPFGGTLDGRVRSNRPRADFYWTTDDGMNPLPAQTITYAGRSLSSGTPVHFDADPSYDVGNLYWDGNQWVDDPEYPDIVKYQWEYGDETIDTYLGGNLTYRSDHTYADYNQDGWLVKLTVWDSEGEYWSSTWCYGGPDETDVVPMWRDVGIADIWPSLPPYQNWDEYGDDWWVWWWLDTVDYWLPHTNDAFWDYHVDTPSMGYPTGTTVRNAWDSWRSEGLYIAVNAYNYGSVPEDVTIKLYAQYIELDLSISLPPPRAMPDCSIELVRTWQRTIGANARTGFSCWTTWLPSENGTYLLFATIEAQENAAIYDCSLSNNYFLLPRPICNEAVWYHGNQTLLTDSIFTQYMCDVDGNGKVGAEDFALLSHNFGKRPPFSP